MPDCEYCGTTLTEDGANATDGTHHFAAQCREYVFAALRSYRQENTVLRRMLTAPCPDCRLEHDYVPTAEEPFGSNEFHCGCSCHPPIDASPMAQFPKP